MPVIVNSVLNEHQLVLDIVAFVALGDFPRSRLGEKQRGKILGNWVSRSPKMRTIAQFSVRDPDAEGSVGTAVPEEGTGRRGSAQSGRAGASSLRRGAPGTTGSSLRHVESVSRMPVAEEPADTEGEEPALYAQYPEPPDRSESRSDSTPTNENPRPLKIHPSMDYSSEEEQSYESEEALPSPNSQYQMRASWNSPEMYNPYDQAYNQHYEQHQQPQELEGEASYLDDSPVIPQGSFGSGLRVANRTSSNESDEWQREALRSLNLRR